MDCKKLLLKIFLLTDHVQIAHPKNLTSNAKTDVKHYYGEIQNEETFFCIQRFVEHRDKVISYYSCTVCKKEFKSFDRTCSHYEAVCGKDIKNEEMKFKRNIMCIYCPTAFSKEIYLSIHLKDFHDGQKKNTKNFQEEGFMCPYCGDVFEDKNGFNSHIFYLNKQCKNEVDIKSHEKNADEKGFTCQNCGDMFENRNIFIQVRFFQR